MQLLVLHADNLRQQTLPVIFGKLCLFPDVCQNKLFQRVLIDGVDGAGFFSAPRIAAANKGTVPPRSAILIGEPFNLVAHFETAVRAVNKARENTPDAIGGIGFAYPFLVDGHHRVPNLTGDDRLMGALHTNPVLFGFAHQLFGLVGERPAFALDHVANVGFVAEHHLHGAFVPQMIDAAGIAAALALVIQLSGRLDALGVEGGGDFSECGARGPHSKHTADQRGSFLVNNEMVLVQRVPLVAVGRMGAHVFSVFRTGFFDGFHFFAGVTAVKLVEQVQKTHDIGAAVIFHGVDAVVERDKPAPDGGEQIIGVLSKLDVVPAKPGKVFNKDDVDASGFGVSDQPLDAGALEIGAAVAVINIYVYLVPALLPHISLKQQLLERDLSRIILA